MFAKRTTPQPAATTPAPAEPRPRKPQVSIFLGYPLFDEVNALAQQEPVQGISAFVREIFRYGFTVYKQVGSLKELKSLAATAAPAARPARISETTWQQLLTALRIILDQAPSTVIEDVVHQLTSRAGKYARSSKP